MLNVNFFTFNAFQENTYVITDEKKRCWFIDPGMYGEGETAEMISFVEERQLLPQTIINTHAHLDHIFGVQALIDRYHIPFGLHELELPVLNTGTASAAMFGFDFRDIPRPTFYIKEGTSLQLGDETLTVLHTPGHSPGSISFYYPRGSWVISGDALFAGSIGRTDLPGGNYETLISAIRNQLFQLPGTTRVLSGHGDETTIEEEKRHNPFLQ